MADLATLLETEANAEIEAILAEARREADGILKAATEQAQTLLESRRRALETEFAAGQTRAKSAAEIEASALRLSANHGSTQKAFAQAEAELRAFTKSGEYKVTLGKLINEAKNALGTVSKLQANPNELDAVTDAAKTLGLNVPVEASADIETGVRAFATGGQTSITNTLLGRLGRARDSILSDVSRLLTPGS